MYIHFCTFMIFIFINRLLGLVSKALEQLYCNLIIPVHDELLMTHSHSRGQNKNWLTETDTGLKHRKKTLIKLDIYLHYNHEKKNNMKL